MSNNISKEISNLLDKYSVASEVQFVNEHSQIVIYSTKEATLSDYVPILQNLQFNIANENHHTIQDKSRTIYTRTYTLIDINKKQLEKTQDHVKEVLDAVLQQKLLNTELNSFSLLANFDPCRIYLLTAIITYEDQLLPEQTKSSISKNNFKKSKYCKTFC